jgi:transposase
LLKITIFSYDLWDGFLSKVKAVFPNADIVANRFHVFKLLNHVLDKDYRAIKWLLFKHWEDLDDRQKRRLLRAFRKSTTLRQLYFTKNELRNIFESDCSKKQAREIVEQWIKQTKN